jgi:hypothetical protein
VILQTLHITSPPQGDWPTKEFSGQSICRTYLLTTDTPATRAGYSGTDGRIHWGQLPLHSSTKSQSASLSWNKAPIWGLRPDFYYCQLWVCWCGALSLTRVRVCRVQLLLALTSAVIFRSESRGTRDHILLSQIRDFAFRRLLQLAGLWWRYSTPPPHRIIDCQFSNDPI